MEDMLDFIPTWKLEATRKDEKTSYITKLSVLLTKRLLVY